MSSQSPYPPDIPPGFDDLTREEQVEYVQRLWNRIATGDDELKVPDWHRELIRQRLKSTASDETSSWDEVKQRLEGRSGD